MAGLIFTLNLVGAILTPTTKEMCAVYVVDYLQTNDDARQLPDKMIKAANVYFDEMVASQDHKQAGE